MAITIDVPKRNVNEGLAEIPQPSQKELTEAPVGCPKDYLLTQECYIALRDHPTCKRCPKTNVT